MDVAVTTASSNHTHRYEVDGQLADCSLAQVIYDEFGVDTGFRVCVVSGESFEV